MALSNNSYNYGDIYTRVVWHNLPSTASPINETNLNKMDIALNTLDERVVQLNTVKAEKTDMLQAVKSITYDTNTGLFTFTWFNGTVKQVDLNIEKIPVDFSLSADGILTMTNTDGTKYTCDVGYLVKLYTFVDSDQIQFTVTEDADKNKTVTATIKAGSITDDKIQPHYLADITTQASLASSSATAANSSANAAAYDAQLAQSYAIGGSGIREGEDTDNAKFYSEQAAQNNSDSAANAQVAQEQAVIATNNAQNAITAKNDAVIAKDTAVSSMQSAIQAATTATNKASEAATSATNAATSESNATVSESNAADSAADSADSATKSESYAVGGTNTRTGEDTDNAKFYSEQSKLSRETVESLATTIQGQIATLIEDALGDVAPEAYVDTDTGHLMWRGSKFVLWLDESTGHLMWRLS